MFDGTFEMATITRTGSDGLARVIVRHSWSDRESLLVDAREAELVVFRRWVVLRCSRSRRAGSLTCADYPPLRSRLQSRLREHAQQESTGLGLPRRYPALCRRSRLDYAHRDQTIVKAIQARWGRCPLLLPGRLLHSTHPPLAWPFSRARVYGWCVSEK